MDSLNQMDSLDALTRFGHVEPADRSVIDAAALAVLDTADVPHAWGKPPRRMAGRMARRPRRVLVGLASVAAAAAFTVTGLSLSLSGAGSGAGAGAHASHLATPVAPLPQHAPAPGGKTILTRLASVVRAAPAPAGDATLVIRSQVEGSGAPILGADLYTDSGEYYYASSESGLPAQVAADDNQGNGVFAREIAAAEQAAGATSLSAAAHAMEYAADPTAPAPTLSAITDNWLWENSIDALVAGSGNPTVRAGVMRLISTLPGVQVVDTTVDGRPAVQITGTFPITAKCTTAACAEKEALISKAAGDTSEQLTLDAATGVPISLTSGVSGQAASAQTTYQVSRVSVAEVTQGHFALDPANP